MGKPEFIIKQGPASGEMAVTSDQALKIAKSCTAVALKALTPDERQQLLQAIADIRKQVAAAQDKLTARLSKVNAQVSRLQEQYAAVRADDDAFSNFYRQMSPAIAGCAEAAEATVFVHAAIQPVTRQAVELDYQILLAKTQSVRVRERMARNQNALNYLDRVTIAVS